MTPKLPTPGTLHKYGLTVDTSLPCWTNKAALVKQPRYQDMTGWDDAKIRELARKQL